MIGFTYLPVGDFTRLLRAAREPLGGWTATALAAAAHGISDALERAARLARGGSHGRGRRACPERCVLAAGIGDGRWAGRRVRPTSRSFRPRPQLALLLDWQRREPLEELGGFLRLTFAAMASLGLRDQIGGGFFRYVTDPGWQVPHFEKMLYDNALLAELYFDAADILGRPAFERVAMDTVEVPGA